jgi:hypothetical protein
MEISPSLGIALMMNNYLHDVATALMAASAFCLFAMVKVQSGSAEQAVTIFFLKCHRIMVGFFRIALCWIIIGGIPRTIFFTRFEWVNAAGKGQIPALAVKHIIMVILVVWGFWAWRRLKLTVAVLNASLPDQLRNEL